MRAKVPRCLLVLPLLLVIGSEAQTRIAIPSYQDPGSSQWDAWKAPGSKSVGIMIVNESNGDDTTDYPAIASAIRKARAEGIFVVGYVYTGYGQRDPAVVRNLVDAVFKNYLVDGIFFDEAPTDCLATNPYGGTNYSYYQRLGEYIRSRQVGGRLVILNPGTQPANDCWMSIANILVTAESSSLQDYRTNYQDQAWFHKYPPSRFWHIVYAASGKDQLSDILNLSLQRGAGWLYVTDLGSANPYAGPPGYWTQETALVANQGIQSPYAIARPASTDEAGNSVPSKVSFRWKAANGARWQIFLSTDTKSPKIVPAASGLAIAADKRIDVAADGSVRVFTYCGDGKTWDWQAFNDDAEAFTLEPQVHLVDLDSSGLGQALRYQIRSLDEKNQVLSTSMPIPLGIKQHRLHLRSTGSLSDAKTEAKLSSLAAYRQCLPPRPRSAENRHCRIVSSARQRPDKVLASSRAHRSLSAIERECRGDSSRGKPEPCLRN